MKTIVAIGGYVTESSKKETFDTPLLIDREIVRLSGKKKPRVLFISTASSDSPRYIRSFLKVYQDQLNCTVETLQLIQKKPSQQMIESKIETADIIYVGGGNTLKMMTLWRRLCIDRLLKTAWEKGTILCGASAGSICWFEYGISDSRQFYKPRSHEYIRVRGLGFLPMTHCPHYGSSAYDKGHRTRGMKAIMKRTKGSCLAIPDGAAVVFRGAGYSILGEEDAVKKCFWEKGNYKEESLEKTGLTTPL